MVLIKSFVLASLAAAAAAKSAVLDLIPDNFDKVVLKSGKPTLVEFFAPWCGHCKNLAPTWEKLAENFANEPNVLVAKVDADAETGKATAAEYGVKGYPTIKFFPAGSTTPEDYSGARSEEAFVTFLNEKAGTHRAVGGGLDAVAGTIESLDAVVAKLVGGTALSEAAAEAKKTAESLTDKAQAKHAEYYLRVFEKLGKSEEYAAKELARLEGIIKKGGLAPTKLDELTSKTNILRKFVEKPTESEDKEEKEEKEEKAAKEEL